MKNTTRKKKPHRGPSEKSRWAYWMQAIEPASMAINDAFPGYHPQWLQQSQAITISAENFKWMRKALGMSQPQCAAYLRVGVSTVRRWESGKQDAPFMAFELLRMVYENAKFKLSHSDWDGWFINNKGALISPNVGGNGYTPAQLDWLSWQQSDAVVEAKNLRAEVVRLKSEVDVATEENTRLRQMFVTQGVVDELAAMQDTISELMSRIATAKIIPFQTVSNQPLMEKTA